MTNRIRPTILLLALTCGATAAHAGPQADVEVDPLAYALGGSSVHVGIHQGRLRADLGAFSLDVPEAFHGNADFSLSMAGAGLKLDYFAFTRRSGLHMGAEVSVVKSTVIEVQSTQAERHINATIGARLGYRIDISKAFYVDPWIGLGYVSGRDLQIAGRTYSHSNLSVFPTVHLGYRFD